jgi:outer membrane protein assembly factor BamE (lipoprotein component of BamABCDE complex)
MVFFVSLDIQLRSDMKKILIIAVAFLFAGCAMQNLTNSYQLAPGMDKQNVLDIMGAPIKSDFSKNVEEWFYCRTGIDSDEHLVLFFHNGKLVTKNNYTVTMRDTRTQAGGSCEKFVKMGNYREPDEVKEIRLRY